MNMNQTRLFHYVIALVVTVGGMLGGEYGFTQARAAATATGFAPLEQWRDAVLAGDVAALKAFYSTDPVAQVMANGVRTDVDADVNFWLGLKARSVKLETVAVLDRPNGMSIVFKADVQLANGQTLSVTDGQMWRKQDAQWRVMSVERADAPHLKQPSNMKKNIYPADADAHAEIREAEEKAAAGHKRVLLVFGANWCYDCHVLDLAFHHSDLTPLLEANYEVVHVDVGEYDRNLPIAERYNVPLNKGLPALAVLDQDGHLLFSQSNGEFEAARSLGPEDIVRFLNQWKPQPAARN